MADENNSIFGKDSRVWHCWTDKDSFEASSWGEIHLVLEQPPNENSTAVVWVGCKDGDLEFQQCKKEYDRIVEESGWDWKTMSEDDLPEYNCPPKRDILQCRLTDTNANFKRDDDLGIDRIWTFGDGRTAVMKPDNIVLYYKKNSRFPTETFWYCEGWYGTPFQTRKIK